MRKLIFLILSLPIGFCLTYGILWIFGIEVAQAHLWQNFPEGWQVYDLVKNAAALLFFYGLSRAAFQVMVELWGKKVNQQSDHPEITSRKGDP